MGSDEQLIHELSSNELWSRWGGGFKSHFLPSCSSKKNNFQRIFKKLKTEKQRLRLLGPVRADHCRCRDVIKEKAQIILPRCSVEDLHRAFSRSGLFFIFFLIDVIG